MGPPRTTCPKIKPCLQDGFRARPDVDLCRLPVTASPLAQDGVEHLGRCGHGGSRGFQLDAVRADQDCVGVASVRLTLQVAGLFRQPDDV